jgi:hypothetical protein
MSKFTIEEIRNYLKAQDSLGDIFYNLSEENVLKAQPRVKKKKETIIDEVDDNLTVYKPSPEYVEFGNVNTDGLEWAEVSDIDDMINISTELEDIEPYHTNETEYTLEKRFNLNGIVYRTILKEGSDVEVLEQLYDIHNCKHLLVKDGVCLDCDIIV